eukprot:CAMPEP_0117457196 /NCGR_PEP_ID=MMETSP0784-20121206/267_1 /TAXON_ID=39447 /ORGANISM="" /LENGTH=88 /DNA_ID=CAMNT_0005250629 /DNA_START=65 /DNA_END=331 /DNA_ORIENTATION=-
MCPLRLVFMLLGALGVVAYTGSWTLDMVASKKGGDGLDDSWEQRYKAWLKRLWMWFVAVTVIALHADVLLSLGYTRCAFQYAARLHQR